MADRTSDAVLSAIVRLKETINQLLDQGLVNVLQERERIRDIEAAVPSDDSGRCIIERYMRNKREDLEAWKANHPKTKELADLKARNRALQMEMSNLTNLEKLQ